MSVHKDLCADEGTSNPQSRHFSDFIKSLDVWETSENDLPFTSLLVV